MNVAANRKHRTHDEPCAAGRFLFRPFSVSLFGVFDKEANLELKRLARERAVRDPRLVYSQHIHRLRVKISNHLGNCAAEAVIRRRVDAPLDALIPLLRNPY